MTLFPMIIFVWVKDESNPRIQLEPIGISEYWGAYCQSVLFLEVMNWFDGIVIDRLWVGHDPFWKIEGINVPYVQTWKQVLVKRGILSVIWIIISFATAGLITLLR